MTTTSWRLSPSCEPTIAAIAREASLGTHFPEARRNGPGSSRPFSPPPPYPCRGAVKRCVTATAFIAPAYREMRCKANPGSRIDAEVRLYASVMLFRYRAGSAACRPSSRTCSQSLPYLWPLFGKWEALYLKLHPQTKMGGAPGAGKGKGKKVRKTDKLATFQEDTAAKIGRSARSARRAIALWCGSVGNGSVSGCPDLL